MTRALLEKVKRLLGFRPTVTFLKEDGLYQMDRRGNVRKISQD